MAIYHLTVKTISRGKGQSAVASAAYRRAEYMKDERYLTSHDYTQKTGVIHSEITIPDNAPLWMHERLKNYKNDPRLASEKFWNFVECCEVRKDAQLARELEFALPIELTKEQNITLAREYIHDQFALRGMIADWSVHWDKGNPHVHVMLTLRELTDIGFGKKVRTWNDRALMFEWREKWAEYANFHLKKHQHDISIDHRSYQDQGIDLVPGIHLGTAVSRMYAKEIDTNIVEASNFIKRENLARIASDPYVLFHKMEKHSSTFSHTDLAHELSRYINDRGNFSDRSTALDVENAIDQPLLSQEAIANILQGIEHHHAVFSEHDIAKAVSKYTSHSDLFARAVLELKVSDQVIALGVGDDGRNRFTTRHMFELENQALCIAQDLQQHKHQKISSNRIHNSLKQYEKISGKLLTEEQRQAVMHLVKPTSIACLVGRAGTGKSFSLGAAKNIWESAEFNVHGVALSGIAADGLSKDAGIQSRTIASFKLALEKEHITLTDRSIVVMDEAGMTDTPSMLSVIAAVEKAHAKLVLVGDHAQLQPVGAGASFRGIIERTGFAEIQHIYRQQETWQREATVHLAAGKIGLAIDAYHAHENIHFKNDTSEAIEQLTQALVAHRNMHPDIDIKEYLTIAYENKDVDALNRMIRNSRITSNEIAEGYTTKNKAGEIKISQGDRIIFLKNDRTLGVSNGRFATIASVNFTESGKVIHFTAKLDGSEKTVLIDPTHYSDFAYGYAATVHKVQGVTVDHTFNYIGNAGWNRHSTYVALSRHRKTCRFYTSHEHHKDIDALKKGLSRYGMKDSLLDFPLAFAERRGIDTTKTSALLPKSLAARLSQLKEKLSDRYHMLMHPNSYWEKKEAFAQEKAHIDTLTQTREDARLVAHYIDKKRKVGIAWKALQNKLSTFGLEKLSYAEEDQEIISRTPEYLHYQKSVAERDAAALPLASTPERFIKAFDIYGLELLQLEKESKAHHYREEIARYQLLLDSSKSVLRDRLAATMMPDIKSYYPHLKAANVDTKALRTHALQHVRRSLLSTLPKETRKVFYAVEQYQNISQSIGKQYAENKITDLSLSEKREDLAAYIVEHKELAKEAFNFFQIGQASSVFSEFDEQKKAALQLQAETRLQKLEQAAIRRDHRERVIAYISAFEKWDTETARRLAHEIIGNPKAHHGAVINHTDMPSAIWKTIRKDANLYVRDRFFETLTPEKQKNFLLVEAYVEEKRANAKAWAGIFEAIGANIPEPEWKNILLPLTKAPTQARNKLAAEIYKDIQAFKEGIEFFNINPEHLQKAAYAHLCHEYVALYAAEKNIIQRAHLAGIIAQDPKAHHAAMLDFNLSWKDLYKHQKPAQRQYIFSTLSTQEKNLWRLSARYQKVNQTIGKRYANIFAAKAAKTKINSKYQDAINTLTAKRDYLAHQLIDAKRIFQFSLSSSIEMNKDPLEQYKENHFIQWEKVEKQAEKHIKRVEEVKSWQTMQHSALNVLPHLLDEKKQETSKNIQVNKTAYYDWIALKEDAETAHKAIAHRLDNYTYALQLYGTSKEKFKQQQDQQRDLKETLSKIISEIEGKSKVSHNAHDPDLQKRIARARTIERESKTIKGTLAEKYFREHRGIKGALSHSFRYHPGLYNGEAKQKLPALVVIAKNIHKETNAVQVIFLDKTTGNKAKLNSAKLTYGSLTQESTGVLVNAGKNTKTIAIAEGSETALSIAEARPDLRVYAVLGSSNFTRAPIHSDTQKILFCADNDGKNSASQKKLHHAAQIFSHKGLEVWQAMPEKEKQDFNDVLKTHGKEAVRATLNQAKPLEVAENNLSVQNKIDAIVSIFKSENQPHIQNNKDISASSIQKNQSDFSITPEREKRYEMIINKYRQLKLIRDNDLYKHPDTQAALEEHAYKMSQRPRLMSYVKTQFPKMFKNIHTLSKSRLLNKELSIER